MRNYKDCTGCGACVQICPDGFCRFVFDSHGFFYPTCDGCSKKASCHLCDDVCPRMPVKENEHSRMFACRAKDEKLILNGSSSGGIFQILANTVIDNNGVVFGAVLNKDFKVMHQIARSRKELAPLLGSKYVQSDTCNAYKQTREFIRIGKTVLFSGTPCQIAGLKSFLGDDLSQSPHLLCIDLICHGVASTGIWNDYVNDQKKNEFNLGKLSKITFRFKDSNMPNDYNIQLGYKNSTITRDSSNDDFYQQFFKRYILRPSCYHCDFRGLSRKWTDISLGDFPKPDKLVPEIYSPYGTSLVISHNEKGTDFFKRIENQLVNKEITDEMLNNILETNPAIISSHNKPEDYSTFWAEYESRGYYASRVLAVPPTRKRKPTLVSLIRKSVKFVLRKTRIIR